MMFNMEFLHPAMWHVALQSWQWIYQVAAPCSVIRGSVMTCHWIRPNVRHIEILYLVSISTTVDMSFCTSLRNVIQISQTILGKKMTSCRLSRWRVSAILDFRGPVMCSLKSPCTTSYRSSTDTIALNWLLFEKIAFLHFDDRRTDGQHRCTKPLSANTKNVKTALKSRYAVDIILAYMRGQSSRQKV